MFYYNTNNLIYFNYNVNMPLYFLNTISFDLSSNTF